MTICRAISTRIRVIISDKSSRTAPMFNGGITRRSSLIGGSVSVKIVSTFDDHDGTLGTPVTGERSNEFQDEPRQQQQPIDPRADIRRR